MSPPTPINRHLEMCRFLTPHSNRCQEGTTNITVGPSDRLPWPFYSECPLFYFDNMTLPTGFPALCAIGRLLNQ